MSWLNNDKQAGLGCRRGTIGRCRFAELMCVGAENLPVFLSVPPGWGRARGAGEQVCRIEINSEGS